MTPNLCIFYKNHQLCFGLITKIHNNRHTIIPEQGKTIIAPRRQLVYTWYDKKLASVDEFPTYLDDKKKILAQIISQIDLITIHELCDKNKNYSIEDLARNFLSHPDDPWHIVALIIALKQEKYLFRTTKKLISARSLEDIKIIKQAEAKLREKTRLEKLEKLWLESLKQNLKPQLSPQDEGHFNLFINRLFGFAVDLNRHPEKEYFCRLLNRNLSGALFSIEYFLAKILQAAKINTSWGRILLARTPLGKQPSAEVIAAVHQISQDSAHLENFKQYSDETHLEVYSIDNLKTRDFDDAVSLEKKGTATYVRLHISAASEFIIPDSPLFNWAEEMISSIYTPKKVFAMLPIELSEDKLALTAGQERLVLTFSWQLDADYQKTNFSIYQSRIKISKNLTYEQVNDLLKKADPFWCAVNKFCAIQRESRKEKGAIFIERREVTLDISDTTDIKIAQIRTDTPASLLVEELSIQANQEAGFFLKERSQLAIYRYQKKPGLIIAKTVDGKEIVDRTSITAAQTGTKSWPHHGLGIPQYARATSPLRRFSDLVNQILITSHLKQQPIAWDENQIFIWAKRIAEQSKLYQNIEKELLTHWKYKYLSQHVGCIFELDVLGPSNSGMFLFSLRDLQLPLKLALNPNNASSITVKIDAVDIINRHVKTSLVSQS